MGHLLHRNFTDCYNILNRRNSLIGQVNDVLCYFGKLSPVIKVNLLYSYCSSLYGCEIWDLNSSQLSSIAVSWRKALKRVWNLPYGTHAHVLYALCGKWPIEEEICRRSLRFAVSCINSDCSVVRDVARMNLLTRPAQSVIGKNMFHCCERYNLKMFDLLAVTCQDFKLFTNAFNFRKLCCYRNLKILSIVQVNLLFECIWLRDGVFKFSSTSNFDSQLLNSDSIRDIILFICTG